MGEVGEYWREHRDYQRSLPKLDECWKCGRIQPITAPICVKCGEKHWQGDPR